MCDLICPACEEKLEITDDDVVLYGCTNQHCNTSTHYHELVGTKEMWEKAIVGYAAIDVALKELRKYAHGEYTIQRAMKTVEKIEQMLKTGQIQ